MPARRTIAAFFAALSLGFLGSGPMAAEKVRGSGQVRTEARPVSPFEAIRVTGGMKIVLRQAGREGVEVRADDNLLALIETRVVNGADGPTLEIGPVRNVDWSSRHDVEVTVDLVRLKALRVDGSSDVHCDALKTSALALEVRGSGDLRFLQLEAEELRVRVAGSGDVEARGRARRLAVSVAGSGDVNTRGLVAESVSVTIAGSGDASVNAQQTLAVSIAGSGDVTYTGDAALQSSIAGSGTVRRR